jgi:hypothetical protein
LISVEGPRRGGRGMLGAGRRLAVVTLLVAAGGAANAAKIEWSGAGAYEACLEQGAEAWLANKAELIVANDEGARATSDGDVAAFTVGLMKTCSDKAQPASAANDAAFTKYMARWRDHVYELARVIRATGGSD